MRKKLLALALTLALVVSLCPATLAAGPLQASEANTNVEKLLANLQTRSGFLSGEKPSYADECFTFAKRVFKELFGYDTNTLYYHGELKGASPNLVRVGRCFVAKSGCNADHSSGVDATSITADTVKALLSKAKCGDILQTTRFVSSNTEGCSVGRPHTMIVQQVKSNSVVVYEANWVKDTIGYREITFKDFASKYDHVITVYRANNYDKVNGSSSGSTTVTDNGPCIYPTTEPGQNLPQGKPFYFKGTITSVSKVTSATISILSADGKTTLQTKTITPNTATVDIATSGLDALKFGQLSPGSYMFYLTATSQSGKTSTWQKGFSIAGTTPPTPTPAPQSKPTITASGVGSDDVNLMENIYPYIQYKSSSPATVTMTATVNASPLAASEITVTENSSNYYSCKFPARVEGTYTVQFTVKNADGSVSSPVYKIHSSLKSQPQQTNPSQSAPPASQTSEMYNISIQYFLDGALFSTYNIPIKHGDSTAFDLRIERGDIPALVVLEGGTWDEAYTLAFVDVRSNITANLYYETPEEEPPVSTSTPTSAPTPSSKPAPTSTPTATAQPSVKPSTTPEPAPQPSASPTPTSTGSLSNFHSVNTYYSGTFYDVASSDWFDENVSRAYELGLMKGMSNNAFDPNSSVTVAQTITLAARLHSIYYTGSENFVQSGSNWYDVYVDYARNNGIHYTGHDYSSPISRGDFAYILAKALPAEALPAIDSDIYFDDVKSTTPHQKYIYLLAQAGIIRGVPNIFGTLDYQPDYSITRAQVAAIVTRMADPSLRQ